MSPNNSLAAMLFAEAAKLRHAVIYDRVILPDGTVECEREYHYLTCKRCLLEKRAWEMNQLVEASGGQAAPGAK